MIAADRDPAAEQGHGSGADRQRQEVPGEEGLRPGAGRPAAASHDPARDRGHPLRADPVQRADARPRSSWSTARATRTTSRSPSSSSAARTRRSRCRTRSRPTSVALPLAPPPQAWTSNTTSKGRGPGGASHRGPAFLRHPYRANTHRNRPRLAPPAPSRSAQHQGKCCLPASGGSTFPDVVWGVMAGRCWRPGDGLATGAGPTGKIAQHPGCSGLRRARHHYIQDRAPSERAPHRAAPPVRVRRAARRPARRRRQGGRVRW